MLSKSSALSRVRLNEITDQSAQISHGSIPRFQLRGLTGDFVHCAALWHLRSLGGRLIARIALASGEVQRDRVLTAKESARYLAACPQPWKDCASIILDEGLRPGEVFALQWPHISLARQRLPLSMESPKRPVASCR